LSYHQKLMGPTAAAAILAALLTASAPPGGASAAVELVRRIEEHSARVHDLTARFVQTYKSGVLGPAVVERGLVSIKRPGRMRWEYKDPEKKTFVSDGKTFYFYVPADRQVVVRDQDEERSIPALLLSGKGDILGQFEPGLETGPDGRERLRLVPRKKTPEIERVFVEADAEGRVRSIEVADAQGSRSHFALSDIRENVGLPDRLFRFEIPRGVDVVTG
jgi:outer membrane lipoprotein carrier protein